MMEFPFTDEELSRAAAAVRSSMVKSIQMASDGSCSCSALFERKVERLIKAHKQRQKWRSIASRVAAIFFAVLCALSFWLLANPQARATAINWIKTVYETHIVYRFTDSPSAQNKPLEYRLTWLPDGYIESSISQNKTTTILIYQNKEIENNQIVFTWVKMQEGTAEIISNTKEENAVSINSLTGYFYLGTDLNKSNQLTWIDDSTQTLFYIDAKLPEDILIRIAESHEPK